MDLRGYQRAAVDAVIEYWRRGGLHPLVEIPTGGGKSAVLGELARVVVQECGGRVVIATHRAELIEQDAAAVRRVWPAAPLAIWSASLGKRGVSSITVCGVQTVAKRARDLGVVDVLVVDEAHLIPPEGDGQYQTLVRGLREINPGLRIVGLTATPYRLGQGYLTQGDSALFTSIVYRCDVRQLIAEGYLSPLVTGSPSVQIDTSQVATRMGEFTLRDLELAADIDEVTEHVADDVSAALRGGRTSALLFGCSVAHAQHLAAAVRERGHSCEVITGDTEQLIRQSIIGRFRRREIEALASCDVLTTGFDAPVVDVLAIVRATQSVSLYVQIVGRGMRVAEGKTDCLVLDYGGNIARHGPVDKIRVREKSSKKGEGTAPIKTCANCAAQQPASARVCSECDTEFPPPEKRANTKASDLPILSTGRTSSSERYVVGSVRFAAHRKRSAPNALPTLRVDYYTASNVNDEAFVPSKIASEWVCIEHDGYAGDKARAWWRAHVGTPFPASVDDAVEVLNAGYMKPVVAITTRPDGDFVRVVDIEHGEAREPGDDVEETEPSTAPVDDDVWGDDDIPF
jgi:DNA repair protein RadD